MELQVVRARRLGAADLVGADGAAVHAAHVKHGLARLAKQGAVEYTRISGPRSQLHMARASIIRPEGLQSRRPHPNLIEREGNLRDAAIAAVA